jgi:phosphohistidine phosphatase
MGLLILMRHAKAVRDHEAPSDRARGLTGRGRNDSAAAAAALTDQDLSPGVVIASSAVRTRETAAIVRDALKVAAPVTLLDRLYLAEPEAYWDAGRAGLAEGALVVGHNPGLHALAATLIDRSGDRSAIGLRLLEGFPTAAWAAFEVGDDALDSVMPRLVGGWSPKG